MGVQTHEPTTMPATPMDFIDKVLRREVPTQDDFFNYLGSQTGAEAVLQAVLLLACGLVYLLYGWKVFKVLVVVNAAVLGGILGDYIGGMLQGQSMRLFGVLAGMVLLGVISWPLMKYAVSVMGALAGAFVGFGAWHYVASIAAPEATQSYAWVGAMMGLITLGLLAFIIFRFTIILFTSLQGAFLTVTGLLALAMQFPSLRQEVEQARVSNVHLVPLLFVVPAIIGVAFQSSVGKKGGKKPSGGGGGGG